MKSKRTCIYTSIRLVKLQFVKTLFFHHMTPTICCVTVAVLPLSSVAYATTNVLKTLHMTKQKSKMLSEAKSLMADVSLTNKTT